MHTIRLLLSIALIGKRIAVTISRFVSRVDYSSVRKTQITNKYTAFNLYKKMFK